MSYLRNFFQNFLAVIGSGVVLLMLGGWVLTIIQRGQFCSQQNFFTYRIQAFDQLPAWFFFVLVQMAINGILLFRYAFLEGGFNMPFHGHGSYGYWGTFPVHYVRIFGIQLVIVSASLFTFMAIRHACL